MLDIIYFLFSSPACLLIVYCVLVIHTIIFWEVRQLCPSCKSLQIMLRVKNKNNRGLLTEKQMCKTSSVPAIRGVTRYTKVYWFCKHYLTKAALLQHHWTNTMNTFLISWAFILWWAQQIANKMNKLEEWLGRLMHY